MYSSQTISSNKLVRLITCWLHNKLYRFWQVKFSKFAIYHLPNTPIFCIQYFTEYGILIVHKISFKFNYWYILYMYIPLCGRIKAKCHPVGVVMAQ